MNQKVVILGTAHRFREPGKCSPDGRLKEFMYSREIVNDLECKLKEYGIITFIDMWEADLPESLQSSSVRTERQRELSMRVNTVNSICDRYGKENCCYVSIHVNASASDGKWHSGNGWQVCVSPQASANSKALAGYLFDEADGNTLIKTRQPKPRQKYWEQSLYVLNRTHCPAVLTENLFQDNYNDVEFLLSDLGRHSIERLHLEGILRYINYLNTKK